MSNPAVTILFSMCYRISNILLNNTGDTPVNDKVSTYYKEIKIMCVPSYKLTTVL